MAATRVASSDVARAQNPAYRLALPPDKKMPASRWTPAFFFCAHIRRRALRPAPRGDRL